MAELRLRSFPDPILQKKPLKVTNVGEKELKLLSEMASMMYLKHGVGLAASQVGIDLQLAVIDVGDGLINLINPVISKKSGRETMEEGCLSVPNVIVKVKRAKSVVVHFLNESGIATQLAAEGLLARAIQHEVDHLTGKLIIDYLGPIKRLLVKKRLSRKG